MLDGWARLQPIGIAGGSHGPPSWLPLAGSTQPILFADFLTEGTTNHYWDNGAQYAVGFSAWNTAVNGTVSRASAAYYTNSSGNLASAGNNVLRFDYDPMALTPKGILLEGASTNQLTHSQLDSGWTTTRGTLTANAATAPDGTMTAASFVPDTTASSTHFANSPGVTTNQAGTYSVFVKANGYGHAVLANSPNFYVYFNLTTGAVEGTLGTGWDAAGSQQFANGWWRIWAHQPASTSMGQVFVGPFNAVASSGNSSPSFTADGTSGIFIWGAELKYLGFPDSYIPTTTGTATRAADSLVLVPSGLVTATASILAGWDTSFTQAAAGADKRIWTAEVSAGSDDIFLGDVSGTLTFTEVSPAVALAISGHAETGTFKDMDAWQAGDQAGAYGGNAPSTGSVAGAPPAFTRLILGDRNAGGRSIWGHIKRFGVYPVRATNATLQSLNT